MMGNGALATSRGGEVRLWRRGLEHKLATLDGALVRSLAGLRGALTLASDEVEIKVWFSAAWPCEAD